MKIKTYFSNSRVELEEKIYDLNYLKCFYSLIEKFNQEKKLNFEVYRTAEKTFPIGDEKKDIESRFDQVPNEFEKHMILPFSFKREKYPFFGSKDPKNMNNFLISLSSYGFKIWPFYDFEGARIFLSTNKDRELGLFGWRALRVPLSNTQTTMYDILPRSGLSSDLVHSIFDFCSRCRVKNSPVILSEFSY